MRTISLTEDWLKGAVSVENLEQGVKPWRLPVARIACFYPILADRAEAPAGVRIAFMSDSARIGVRWVPADEDRMLDLVVEDQLIETAVVAAGDDGHVFEHAPGGVKRTEIYLSQKSPVTLKTLEVDDDAAAAPLPNDRPRWITYGSSITQCGAAASPAQTWPAIVARSKGWDLTCLGYSGQCHIEPMTARVIRDLPADIISLCLGINVQGNGSLNIRTFRSAVIGMVSIIREKHADTPLYIFSPIYSYLRETEENAAGLNLIMMREEIREAVRILQSYGDGKLIYVDGLDIFGEPYARYLPDRLHPDAEGYKIMATNIAARIAL